MIMMIDLEAMAKEMENTELIREATLEVGCDSLPEELTRRLEGESSLDMDQCQEVGQILTSILYIQKLDEEKGLEL